MRDSFVFYRSFKDSISELSDKDKLLIYEAICDFSLDFKEPNLEGFPKALFKLMRPVLEANIQRWKNGCNGGAPKGNKNAEKQNIAMVSNNQKTTKNNQAGTKKQANKDKDVYKDKDIDIDSVCTAVPAHSQDYLNFQKWLSVNCPDIWKGFKSTLTEQEFNKLLESHTKQEIADMTLDMENNKSFVRNHKDLYRSLLTWFRNAERWKGGSK